MPGARHLVLTMIAFAFANVAAESVAQPARQLAESLHERQEILSGKALTDALQQRRSHSETNSHLRRMTEQFTKRTGIGIIVDRRLDPGISLDVSTGYVTAQQILQTVCLNLPDAALSVSDACVYIGPKAAATRLKTLTELNRIMVRDARSKLPGDVYRAWTSTIDGAWPELSEPRSLITEAAATIGLSVENSELIPHDLWAVGELPKMNFTDYLTLLLNQFDLTFTVSEAGGVRVVSVPDSVGIEQRHRVAAADRSTVQDRWHSAFPDLHVDWQGSTAVVFATLETHESLRSLIRGPTVGEVAAASLRGREFSIKVPAGTSFRVLIDQFQKSGIPVRIVGRSGAELDELLQQTLQFECQKLSGEKFFSDVFASLGAKVLVEDERVTLEFSSP